MLSKHIRYVFNISSKWSNHVYPKFIFTYNMRQDIFVDIPKSNFCLKIYFIFIRYIFEYILCIRFIHGGGLRHREQQNKNRCVNERRCLRWKQQSVFSKIGLNFENDRNANFLWWKYCKNSSICDPRHES